MTNSITITIRRNTKAHAQAFEAAKTVRVYSLSNGFSGEPVTGEISSYDREQGRLSQRKHDGSYILRVHGNLWYEWAA